MQHDYDINSSDAISGLQFRQDVNNVLSAIKSSNSGATAPTTYIAGTLWLDTSTTPHILKKRNTANTGWDTIRIEDALGAPIASATTTTVGTYSGGNTVHITGTTTITSLGVSTTGTTRTLIFDSALTITHNATSLILLGAANILTVAGSIAKFVCENGALGYWRCTAISHSAVSMQELLYISTLTSNAQTQLNDKAPIASPTFTGTPTAPNFSYKPTPITVTSWSYVTTTITLNVASHTFVAGDYIEVGGLTATTNIPNGVHLVTSVTATTIVFTYALTPTGTAGVSSATVKGYFITNSRIEGVGVGQTWQNLAGSRALATTYINTTGNPIVVNVRVLTGTNTNELYLTINGTVVSGSVSPGTAGSYYLNVIAIVPNGDSYYATSVGDTLSQWQELR